MCCYNLESTKVVVSVSNVSVSRQFRGVFWTSRSRLDTVTPMSQSRHSNVSVSVSSQSRDSTSRYRLGLGIIRLIYNPRKVLSCG